MGEKQKDRLLVVIAVLAILLGGYVLLNIDKIFSPPQTELSLPVRTNVQFTTEQGTNPNAAMTVVEFSDFQCPYCKQNVQAVKEILAEYGNRINFVYKHFPIEQVHPNSRKAAEAAECARDTGKFWEYHDVLFAHQNALAESDLIGYAQELGIDINECLASGAKKDIVQRDFVEGAQAGVKGTPTFFVNGNKLEGVQPYTRLKLVIDAELG